MKPPGKPRRHKGDGSVYERVRTLESGRVVRDWCAEVSLGYDLTGKRIRRKFYGRKRQDVLLRVAQERARNGGTIAPPSGPTVGEYLESWLASVEISRAGNTYLAYAGRIRRFAIPNIGAIRLASLESTRIAKLYADLALQGVSSDNIQKLHRGLRRAFNVAIGQGLLARNPVAYVERAPHRTSERASMDASEVRRFFVAARGDRLEAMFRLGILVGMRPGELFALAIADVDVENAIVDVRHNLEDVSGKLAIVDAKADSARRVPIDPETATLLRARVDEARCEGHGSPYLFTTSRGKWLRTNAVNNDSLRPILKRAGLPDMTLYSLRHTSGSLFGEAGVSLRVAADVLGHSGTEITADVYTHAQIPQHRDAIARVAALVAESATT